MSIENPTFDPRNKEYKKMDDLPEEEQKNFAEVKGGFITRKAKDYEDAVLKHEKSLSSKIFGGKKTARIIQDNLKGTPKEYMEQQELLKRCKKWVNGEELIVPEKKIMPDKDVPDDAE